MQAMGISTLRRKSRANSRLAGFTLIEAIVAVFVISLFTSALLPLFVSSDRSVRTAQNREAATQAGHEVLEEWREGGFAGLPTIPTGVATVSVPFNPPSTLPKATGVLKVTRVDSTFYPSAVETEYRKVEAIITWKGLRSDRGTVNQTTLIVKER
jgi:type II secretory pathway pseudopilin PulG